MVALDGFLDASRRCPWIARKAMPWVGVKGKNAKTVDR